MSNVGARDEILAGDDPVHPQTAETQRILQAAPPDEVPAIRRLVVAGAQTSSNTQNRRWFHQVEPVSFEEAAAAAAT